MQLRRNGAIATPSSHLGPMVACAALVALIVAPNLVLALRPYDGGIAASTATFTLHGLLPYRDYWLLYGPLSGILLAIPTAVMGSTGDILRLSGLAIVCGQAAAAFLVARSFTANRPAIAIAIAAVVMPPALIGIEPSAWTLGMTLALVAMCPALARGRGGVTVGILVGLTFLARIDVGMYALLGLLWFPGRRSTLLGFGVVAGPFAILALTIAGIGPLLEQLVWFPLVGQRLFRGLPGPDALVGQPAAALLSLPLVIVPRLAIAFVAIRLVLAQFRRTAATGSQRKAAALLLFAVLCQLQTLGRADFEHFAQAATPAILLTALVYRDVRPGLGRFTAMSAMVTSCLVVGLLSYTILGTVNDEPYAQDVAATSNWIQQATGRDEPIFVGLTSHRYTIANPLVIYYLADRRAGVRDAMFNPGVTNTDWGQDRMVADLASSRTRYLVLDRPNADRYEAFNDSRIPGSTHLDTFIAANFHVLCDLDHLVIMARNDVTQPPSPACPANPP